jgi:hypothetical protein
MLNEVLGNCMLAGTDAFLGRVVSLGLAMSVAK